MSRSLSLVLVFSSLCAITACTRAPVASTPRQQPQRIVAPEPMGNPGATEPAPPPSLDRDRLMEPDFAVAPGEPLGVAAIQNLEDPSQGLAVPSPKPVEPSPAPAAYDPLLDYARRR